MKTVYRSDRRKNPESVEYEYLSFDECKKLASESHCHVLDKEGKIAQVKITSVKTWKTSPNELLIGWKFGMYEFGKYSLIKGLDENDFFVRIVEKQDETSCKHCNGDGCEYCTDMSLYGQSEEEPIVCIVCNGIALSLGNLGAVKYYRCQDCGMQFHA